MSRLVPQPLSQVIQEAQEAPRIAARLKAKLGLGTNPEVRQALYQRLEDLVYADPQGRRIEECIGSVVRDAMTKTDPGRFFAYVVVRRLQERGLVEGGSYVDW